jgi:hypothetical protein
MNSSILYVLPSDATSLKDQTSRKPLLQKIKELLIVKFWGMINCTDNTENKLKAEILKFSNLASNPAIQQAFCIYAKS